MEEINYGFLRLLIIRIKNVVLARQGGWFMVKYLFYAVGIFLVWKVVQIGYSWIRLMQLRFRATEIVLGDRAGLSGELSPIFDEVERVLTAMGFCYSHAESFVKCKETMLNFTPALSHVYYHPGLHTYAVAGPPDRPWGVSSFDVSFITILANGEVITTINGLKDLLPPVPDWFKVYDH